MTQRNETLATAFEHVVSRIVTEAEGLSDAAWHMAPTGEKRTAGQIVYHMAQVYHNINGLIQLAVVGQPLPTLTMDDIHDMNAQQVARYVGVDRGGVLEMLRQNGAATATVLHSLSDAQIDTNLTFLGHSMTVESLAQNALVGHTEEHLASIKGAAASA